MEEVVSQGVVEGGFFTSKKKDCEYICIGPNTYDVHSPSERLSSKLFTSTVLFAIANVIQKLIAIVKIILTITFLFI